MLPKKIIKTMNRNQLGVTLLELLIAVAIVGILAAVAYPSYVDHVARSNRTEAMRELVRIANLQEQYFMDNRVYIADLTKLNLSANPFITESGNYSIASVVANAGASFVLTATAKGGQATSDPDCTTLSIDNVGAKTAESTTCWMK